MNRTCVLQPQWCLGSLVADVRDALMRLVKAVVAWVDGLWRPAPAPGTDLFVATYAVLLELLHADAEPSVEERRYLEQALRGQLGLEPRAGCAILREAERARAESGILASIRLVAESYSMPQKVQLVRIMHGLVHLDGVVTRRERYLMRKLANLLRIDSARIDELDRRPHALVS